MFQVHYFRIYHERTYELKNTCAISRRNLFFYCWCSFRACQEWHSKQGPEKQQKIIKLIENRPDYLISEMLTINEPSVWQNCQCFEEKVVIYAFLERFDGFGGFLIDSGTVSSWAIWTSNFKGLCGGFLWMISRREGPWETLRVNCIWRKTVDRIEELDWTLQSVEKAVKYEEF